jgi:hypothetical protein
MSIIEIMSFVKESLFIRQPREEMGEQFSNLLPS